MREWLEGGNCLQRLDLPYSLGLSATVGAFVVGSLVRLVARRRGRMIR